MKGCEIGLACSVPKLAIRVVMGAVCLSLALIFSLLPAPSIASFSTITSAASTTVVVAMYSHDAYAVRMTSGSATIEFTTNSTVDFYVMTATGYSEYVDPNSTSFHYRDLSENAQSFSYSTTQSGLIFVIDNDVVSVGGATPTGPASYAVSIQFAGASPTDGGLSIILAILAAAGVSISIGAVVVMRHRKQRQSVVIAQQAPPTLPIGPLSPLTVPAPPPGSAPAVVPTPGAIRRSLSDSERGMLARDFKAQRVRMIVGSMVGLGFAAAYNVLPNLLTLGFSILAFIAPAMAFAVAKLRAAIVAGQVVDYVGVPVVLGTTRIAKQEFYRLQFGTERVLVAPGVYGRFVANQPTSLTVLRGANAAIAVNGIPLVKMEPVRLEPDIGGATG